MMITKKTILKSISFLLLIIINIEALADGPKNIYKIDDNFYRSARPGKADLGYLQRLGVKTVINLEWFLFWKISNEKEYIEKAGMNYIHFPIGTLRRPKLDDLLHVLEYIADQRNQPVLVHCMNGSDRTGLVVAAYRIVVQHWSIEKAVAEMRRSQYGHKRFLYGWDTVLYKLDDVLYGL